jgi:hypothetical protein
MKDSVALAYDLRTPVTDDDKAVTNVQKSDPVLLIDHLVVGEPIEKSAEKLFFGEEDIHCSKAYMLTLKEETALPRKGSFTCLYRDYDSVNPEE